MRHRLPILALTALALAACAPQEEASDFTPGKMTFPVRSEGMKEHFFDKMIAICRQTADPNDPDCVIRVKSRLEECKASTSAPVVFQTAIEYQKWATRYMTCLDGR